MRFTGSQYQCLACGEHFSGPASFGAHRTGEYHCVSAECLTPSEMRSAGMRLTRTGFWNAPQSREVMA